jgi:hypothetical protein
MPLGCGDAIDRSQSTREPGQLLSHLDRGSFWSPLPLGYADKDALALAQIRDARPLKRGGVYETSFPPLSMAIKAKPLAVLCHFTVPIAWTLASKGRRSDGDLKLFVAAWAGLQCGYLRL